MNFFCLCKIVYRARNQTKIKLANEIKISARRNSVCECLAHLSTHQPPNVHRQFLIWGWGIKSIFKFTLLDFILIIIRLLYATLICQQVEGSHRLLFLSFISLKNEDNHHLTMGVDKTMNLSCAGNWIEEICELVEISLISFPYTKRQTLLLELFRPYEWYTRERRGRKVSKRVIHLRQSRVFPLSMCVMLTYLAFSIFQSIWRIRRARSFFLFTF